jgi:hypothetical protein
MQLKLEELQKVVKSVVNDEKYSHALKQEISRAVGAKVVTTHSVTVMAESANYQLDIFEKTGRSMPHAKASILLKHVNSDSVEVRKLVARLLPESHVKAMIDDRHPAVRAVLVKRLPLDLASKLATRHKSDDNVQTQYRLRKLTESVKVDDKEFDMYGDMHVEDAFDGLEHPGLTDEWYNTLAHRIINGPTAYGNNLEGNWEEKIAKNICDSYKSQGIEVDHEKLLDAVYDHMEMRDADIIKASENRRGSSGGSVDESVLKGIVRSLRLHENLDEPFMPIISEEIDLVESLVESVMPSRNYIEKFEELFEVTKEATYNVGKKQGINEGYSKVIAPSTATVPYGNLRAVDEKALNAYVKNWNLQRSLKNQPYKISWSPAAASSVKFHLEVV